MKIVYFGIKLFFFKLLRLRVSIVDDEVIYVVWELCYYGFN